MRLKWNLAEAGDLLDALTSRAVKVGAKDPGWETLLAARIRTGIAIREVVLAALEGKVRLGQEEEPGLRGLRFFGPDVDTLVEVRKATLPEDLMPVMAFARTVGLRDGARFRALIDAGQVTATQGEHPRNGARFLHVSAQDREDFHRRFVTTSTLGVEHDLSVPEIRARLKAARVHPSLPRERISSGSTCGPRQRPRFAARPDRGR